MKEYQLSSGRQHFKFTCQYPVIIKFASENKIFAQLMLIGCF